MCKNVLLHQTFVLIDLFKAGYPADLISGFFSTGSCLSGQTDIRQIRILLHPCDNQTSGLAI